MLATSCSYLFLMGTGVLGSAEHTSSHLYEFGKTGAGGGHHILACLVSWERSDIWSRVARVVGVVGVVGIVVPLLWTRHCVLKQVGPGTAQKHELHPGAGGTLHLCCVEIIL